MSYAGFGIQSMNSFQRPRKVFTSIFEEILPEAPKATRQSVTNWAEFRKAINEKIDAETALSLKIHLVTLFTVMSAIIVSLI